MTQTTKPSALALMLFGMATGYPKCDERYADQRYVDLPRSWDRSLRLIDAKLAPIVEALEQLSAEDDVPHCDFCRDSVANAMSDVVRQVLATLKGGE